MKAVRSQSVLQLEPLQHMPFLYCTRTILRLPLHCRRVHAGSQFSTTSHQSRESEVSHNKLGTEDQRETFFKEKLRRTAERQAQLRDTSTITPKERQAFKDIFYDIAAGAAPKKSDVLDSPKREKRPLVENREIFSIFSNAPLEDEIGVDDKSAISAIFNAQQDATPSGKQKARPTLSEQDREHIQKYPERLRDIASRATLRAKAAQTDEGSSSRQRRQQAPPAQQQLSGSSLPRSDFLAAETEFSSTSDDEKATIDTISAEQMKRISEILLQAATISDRELWTACENSVFPLLDFLENDPPPLSTPNSLPETARKKKSQRTKTLPFPLPPTTPPLPILSSLFPGLILLTTRLLTTSFPLSPYISLLLPTLRSHGPRSYVLATSTPLYNTLLSHRWDIYSDLNGMTNLLRDMERGGVGFDKDTVAVLEGVRAAWVAETQSKPVKAEAWKGNGRRDRSWWEAEVTRKCLEELVGVGGWRGRIMEVLREQRAGGEAIVEREYADSLAAGGDGAEEAPKVWL